MSALGIGNYERSLALHIGEHGKPERLTRGDWLLFASSLGVPPKPVWHD